MNLAAAMVSNRSLNPGYHSYPGVMYNLGAGVFALWSVGTETLRPERGATGAQPFVVRTNAVARTDHAGAVLAFRALTLAFNLATVIVSGLVAWTVSRRRLPTVVAAGFSALSSVDVEMGVRFSPDPFAGAFVAALALASVRLVDRRTLPRAASAGMALGLATGAKYNMLLMGSMLIVAVTTVRRSGTSRSMPCVAVAATTCIATFAVVSPMTFLDWSHAVEWIRAEIIHYRRGHPGAEGNAPMYNARTLFRMFGPAIVLAPVALTRNRRATPVLFGVVVYVVAMSTNAVRFERTMLAVTAPMAALIGLGAVHVGECVAQRVGAQTRRLLIGTLAVSMVVPATMAALTVRRSAQDPWRDSADWIEAHVRADSTIAVDWFGPWLDHQHHEVFEDALSDHTVDEWRVLGVDFFVTTQTQFNRYPVGEDTRAAFYVQLLDLCRLASFTGNGETIVIIAADRIAPDCPATATT